LLFQAYLKMLLEYSHRRSGLEPEEFTEIVEQLNPDTDMATEFKTIFEVAEERAEARAEAKVKRKFIITLIQSTQWSDSQIAEKVEVPINLVTAIRLELKSKNQI
jgi:hypothetical protein